MQSRFSFYSQYMQFFFYLFFCILERTQLLKDAVYVQAVQGDLLQDFRIYFIFLFYFMLFCFSRGDLLLAALA